MPHPDQGLGLRLGLGRRGGAPGKEGARQAEPVLGKPRSCGKFAFPALASPFRIRLPPLWHHWLSLVTPPLMVWVASLISPLINKTQDPWSSRHPGALYILAIHARAEPEAPRARGPNAAARVLTAQDRTTEGCQGSFRCSLAAG